MLTKSEFEILVRNEIINIPSVNNVKKLKLNFLPGGNIEIYREDGDLDTENESKIKEKLKPIAEKYKHVINNKSIYPINYERPSDHDILEILSKLS